jgi:hypothetical protein
MWEYFFKFNHSYMKIPIVAATVLFVLLLSSCKKNTTGYSEDRYAFDATILSSSISVNDSAKFLFSENPDVLSFYSGEIGRKYEFKDRDMLSGGSLKMKFDSRVINKAADTLDVLVSSNFSGVYDSAGVTNASWKKITNKFYFPTATTALSTYVFSGAGATDLVDISDSIVSSQAFFLAFRYDITKNNNIEWNVRQVGMYNLFSPGTPTVKVIDSATFNSGSFKAITIGEATSKWTNSSPNFKCINTTSAVLGARHWYISKILNPNAVTPDLPVVLKNISQNPLKSFSYKYATPGTYKVVMVASYFRKNLEKKYLKEFTVVVR